MVDTLSALGHSIGFLYAVVHRLLRYGFDVQQVLYQVYVVGVRSFGTTVITAMFVGAIMALQINQQLQDFDAQNFLGGLATSVTLRNVGPVLIAFILSGKVGAYTSAELASMKVSEQIDAIRCLGTDPIQYLVVPRLLAVVISSFLLLVVGIMLTIAGGVLISSLQLGMNTLYYLQNIPGLVTWWSVGMGVFKSLVFGGLIAWIACYQGYFSERGSAGVGKAVRSTAVVSLVSIIIADYYVSWFSGQLRIFLGMDIL